MPPKIQNKEFNFKRFKMHWIDPRRKVVAIAKTGSGKTVLIRDLLYHQRKILQHGQVICPTDSLNKDYQSIIPKIFIHENYDTELIKRQLKSQKHLVETNGKEDTRTCSFLILDDCLHESKIWTKDENMKKVFYAGRHYNILLIIAMQYPMGIPPELRTNIDYVFIFREPNMKNRKRIYENYAGMFETFNEFCAVLDDLTHDYGCMVISNNTNSNRIEDQVFWYKAKFHEEFKLCPQEAWAYSDQNYQSDESDFEVDTSDLNKRYNKQKISINKLS